MGSPYQVHRNVKSVNVIKSTRGYLRLLEQVYGTMGFSVKLNSITDIRSLIERGDGPECGVLIELHTAFAESFRDKARTVTFLEARYEWRGWEKFQRAIVFDFTKRSADPVDSLFVEWILIPFDFGGSSA